MSETTARITVVGLIHSAAKTQSENAERIASTITTSLLERLPIAASSALAQAATCRTRADLGGIDQIDQERQGCDQEKADRQEADRPPRPRDVDRRDLSDQADRKEVRSQGGQEHRACDGGGRERGPHQVGTDPPRGGPGAEP